MTLENNNLNENAKIDIQSISQAKVIISEHRFKITIKLKQDKNNSYENIHMHSLEIKDNDNNLEHNNNYYNLNNIEKRSDNKTKKKKTVLSNKNKSKLWDIFDSDIKNIEQNKNENIECLYSNKELDFCNICNSNLMITDIGFPTCNEY